ncbi:MAG: HEAT repeat domain-containing protein [Planctomycetaceae bacterium]|nr:HEAT repeat domain-containing protein [Planctomycetaceae bacterium]
MVGKEGRLLADADARLCAGAFAYAREETLPHWAEHLRPDICEPMFQGLRFLEKTGDTTLDIHGKRGIDELRPLDDCLDGLKHASASHRLWALNCLAEHDAAAAPAIGSIVRLLHDRDPDIPVAAAHALGLIGPRAAACVPELQWLLTSRVDAQRAEAAYALGAIGTNDPAVLDDLVRALDDKDREVAGAAAFALGKCAPGNDSVARRLLPGFETALRKCDYPRISLIAGALHATSADASALVQVHLAELGADIAGFAEDCLAEAAAGNELEYEEEFNPADEDADGR